MHKYSSFLLYSNGRWDYNPSIPEIKEVQIHLVDEDKGVGVINLKKRITLEEAIDLFGKKNTVILPILTNSQYLEFNRKSKKFSDPRKKNEFYHQWFDPLNQKIK